LTTPHISTPNARSISLERAARFPGLRALAWSGDILYASRGYDLLRARITDSANDVAWQPVAKYCPNWKRRLSVSTPLSARLLRDGFHALCGSPTGALVAAIPGAVVTCGPGESEFRVTHRLTRGTRPLHITTVPGGAIYWGEYFDNAQRGEVHIYASTDAGTTWNIAYTFPRGSIRHIHNIVHDPWANCLWILTGDYGDECRILRSSCDLRQVDTVLQGNQQARAVAAIPMEDGLYFSSDTPLESNFIYRVDREGCLSQLAAISSSSIYGCRVGKSLFFSTMVEPSEANRDRNVRIYGGEITGKWHPLLEWPKDRWPMGLFQYGNAFLPDGDNTTRYLAVATTAVKSENAVTSVYKIAAS